MRSFIHPDVHIGHVHLKVKDADKMITFYKEVIGFQVLAQQGNQTLLTADGETALLVLEEDPTLMIKPARTTGLYHFAILLPERADLARALLHLADVRYPLQGASDHIVSEAVYLGDPEGNGIEIYVDRPREQWEGRVGELMGTEPLAIEDLLATAGDMTWSGLPVGTVMGHIHLHVDQLATADQYYMQGMGFELQVGMANHALFISAGGYHHHIGLNTWAGTARPPKNSTGLRSYALIFPSEEAIEETVTRLESHGQAWKRADGVTIVEDSVGHEIELRVEPLRAI